MKTSLRIAFVLAIALAAGAATKMANHDQEQPAATAKPAKPRIEVCFVLDTTGSMGGLIEGAKQKIWSIANELVAAKPTPDLRIGLVAYRDRGDAYVTKTFDLTNDIDAVYATLKTFEAGGGGDEPESVNEALDAAAQKMSWSNGTNLLKIVFLVGDAPPHMDYKNGPKYTNVCEKAVRQNLIVNTIQCGGIAETARFWKDIARLSEGSYAAIPQSGNVMAISAPQDAELSNLSRKLSETAIGYGGEATRRAVEQKIAVASAAPAPAAADRLAFNSRSGVVVQGDGELLSELSSGKITLDKVRKDQLPPELKKLSDDELKNLVEKKTKERADLQGQVKKLSAQREEYIAAERKRLTTAGKSDSFDDEVAAMIRKEAARQGINYEK